MSNIAEKAAENLQKIRSTRPLIHNITNLVVMNFNANVLLAMGGSPVMAHAENEVEDMVGFAGALVLNIGTLTDEWVKSMVKAGKKAASLGTPIILDPVGSGATRLRTRRLGQRLFWPGNCRPRWPLPARSTLSPTAAEYSRSPTATRSCLSSPVQAVQRQPLSVPLPRWTATRSPPRQRRWPFSAWQVK